MVVVSLYVFVLMRHPETSPSLSPVVGSRHGAARALGSISQPRIFDGHGDQLSALSNLRVKGNRIEWISTEPLPADTAPLWSSMAVDAP